MTTLLRVELFDEEVERLSLFDPLTRTNSLQCATFHRLS